MTNTGAWKALAHELAGIEGPAVVDDDTRYLRSAVELCADEARLNGTSATALIRQLKDTFGESALQSTREIYLALGQGGGNDDLLTQMISWALTHYFRPATSTQAELR